MNRENKNRIRLQEIFIRSGDEFRRNHTLSPVQLKAMKAIEQCRTAGMGSHSYRCENCGHLEVVYNSCRNRHCPRCQWLKQQMWVDHVKSQLLPIRYFHVVFTIPEALNPLVMINHRLMYDFLFEASWHALRKASENPAFLGAQTGALAVLHTWGQTLSLHPHIHMLVPAGGLDPDGWQWVRSLKKFFIPVKALSKMFRACYVRLLLEALKDGKLKIPENHVDLITPARLKHDLFSTNWVVYCKKCFAGPGQVITYLGRYTHRVAISENRIIEADENHVLFRWKDYSDHNHHKQMLLKTPEFIRRFMLHIMPSGFYKIRYYGIFACVNRATKLSQCFELLGCIPMQSILAGLETIAAILFLTGKQINLCPVCGARLLPPEQPPPKQWF
jgi:hypothetical protein